MALGCGESWYQVNVSSGQVAALPRTQASAVLDLTEDEVVTDLEDDDGDEAVVDEDPLALLQNLVLLHLLIARNTNNILGNQALGIVSIKSFAVAL